MAAISPQEHDELQHLSEVASSIIEGFARIFPEEKYGGVYRMINPDNTLSLIYPLPKNLREKEHVLELLNLNFPQDLLHITYDVLVIPEADMYLWEDYLYSFFPVIKPQGQLLKLKLDAFFTKFLKNSQWTEFKLYGEGDRAVYKTISNVEMSKDNMEQFRGRLPLPLQEIFKPERKLVGGRGAVFTPAFQGSKYQIYNRLYQYYVEQPREIAKEELSAHTLPAIAQHTFSRYI